MEEKFKELYLLIQSKKVQVEEFKKTSFPVEKEFRYEELSVDLKNANDAELIKVLKKINEIQLLNKKLEEFNVDGEYVEKIQKINGVEIEKWEEAIKYLLKSRRIKYLEEELKEIETLWYNNAPESVKAEILIANIERRLLRM